ncbi:MAG: hypothetical protein ACI318_06445 [Bacilli bacterium]
MKKSKIVVLLLSLALLFGVGKNNLNLDQNVGDNNRTIMKADEPPTDDKDSIIFGKNNVSINSADFIATDKDGNNWTIKTEGTTSFTEEEAYSHVGSSKKPATSIIFTCTLPDEVMITSCKIKLGGFSGTAGNVLIKFGDTEVGTGSLNETDDVTVPSKKPAASNDITISITGIKKGVKVYWIDYEYATSDSEIAKANINSSDTKAQLKYSFNVTQEEGVSAFVKVTTAPTDWSGDYLIVCEEDKVAFNGKLTTLDAVSNTISATVSGDKIEVTDDLKNALFTVATYKDGYSIQSSSGYYIGQTKDDNGLKSSNSTAYTNTISFGEDGTLNIVSGGAYLRYNPTSGQTRFRYFKSTTYTAQKAICLYKLTKVTEKIYTFSNMKMNLGAVIEAAKVQALVDAGLSISSYGVAVAQKSKLRDTTISDAVNNKSSDVRSYVKFVSADYKTTKLQETDANGTATSGDYVIFNADLSFPDESKYNVEVSAVAFFKLGDGTYVFFQERTLSVASLAQAYINNIDVYNTFDSNVRGSLKALVFTPASVA